MLLQISYIPRVKDNRLSMVIDLTLLSTKSRNTTQKTQINAICCKMKYKGKKIILLDTEKKGENCRFIHLYNILIKSENDINSKNIIFLPNIRDIVAANQS